MLTLSLSPQASFTAATCTRTTRHVHSSRQQRLSFVMERCHQSSIRAAAAMQVPASMSTWHAGRCQHRQELNLAAMQVDLKVDLPHLTR